MVGDVTVCTLKWKRQKHNYKNTLEYLFCFNAGIKCMARIAVSEGIATEKFFNFIIIIICIY